jgi:CBS domain-containing protein/SAM-dependent methyltransferase
MKVSDVMRKSVVTVSENTPLKEVGRIIFSLGVSFIPVVKERKLLGILTQEDILSRMYPTMQEVTEDLTHARNFEDMEQNLKGILDTPVKDVMNQNFQAIDTDTPVMKAQSIILINNFSHLPVVNKKGEIEGVISQGDIYRYLLRNEMPQIEQQRYAGFIAKHYDIMVDWEKRFGYEFPVLFDIFRRENVRSIVDLGVWTGEYSIGLAKSGGYHIMGLDHNSIMVALSKNKKKNLPKSVQEKLQFELTDFDDLSFIKAPYDAAICMGNSLPYLPVTPKTLVENVNRIIRKKNPVFIMQLLNFDKYLETNGRLLSFKTQNVPGNPQKELLFIEYLDKKDESMLNHNVVIFENDGKNWVFEDINTISVRHIRRKDMEKVLVDAGFDNITMAGNAGEYQGDYGPLTFTEPFDAEKSDWLNILATKW